MMRQSSEPCTGSVVVAPPLSRCADYLPSYPLRLVASMAATSNLLYKTTNFYGFEGHLDPYVAPCEAQLSTGATYSPRIENTGLSAI